MKDDGKLKMKFKLHELEFEIEGNQEVVTEQFDNFKSFITGDLLPKINVTSERKKVLKSDSVEPTQIQETTAIEVNDYPAMKEIVMRDLPKSEVDWVLIYGFYASKFGVSTFTNKNIIEQYDLSGRKSDNHLKHVTRNLGYCLNKNYFKVHNDSEYIVKEEGKKYAKQILDGKSTSKSKKVKSEVSLSKDKKSKKVSTTQGFKLNKNLNLRPDGKESLIDFAAKYKTETNPERILMIVYYLKEILELDQINSDHIYTGYEALNIRVPKSLYQLISDSKNKSGWLDFESMENIMLSIQGKNAMRFDLILQNG